MSQPRRSRATETENTAKQETNWEPEPTETPVTARDTELEIFNAMRAAVLARDRAQAEIRDREVEVNMREERVRGLQSQATQTRDQIKALADQACQEAFDAKAAVNLDLLREQVAKLGEVAEVLWVETEDYRVALQELTAKREALVRLEQERHATSHAFQNAFPAGG